MGILGKILKTTVHIISTPVDLIKDAATLGGELIDEQETSITKKMRRLKKDVNEINETINNW